VPLRGESGCQCLTSNKTIADEKDEGVEELEATAQSPAAAQLSGRVRENLHE